MTVIKGNKVYSFPTTSGNNSDSESLHLGGSATASDAESLHNEPVFITRPFRPSTNKLTHIEDLVILKKSSGRKKLRRYQNRCLLQTLAEDEEDDTNVVVMETYNSPFTKLLQDNDALEFWNVFIDKSEEEQAQLLDTFSNKIHKTQETQMKPSSSFPRISQKIKHTIKLKKNLSLEHVKQSEDDLIAFFKSTPDDVYVQHPPTYFERLLLHAIAQYHNLQSLGVAENGCKRVEVFNSLQGWIPAECFLTDFVAQIRK